jgi:hypothetical protein
VSLQVTAVVLGRGQKQLDKIFLAAGNTVSSSGTSQPGGIVTPSDACKHICSWLAASLGGVAPAYQA